MRKSRDETMMQVAEAMSQRSTCLRNRVGAVIAHEGRPVSVGYNGVPSGMPHCTPETCGPNHPCTDTVHAELNAVSFSARYGIPTKGATLYCTLTPCRSCADAIIQAGIKRAVFKDPYRDLSGWNRLRECGIEVVMLP